VLLEKHQRKRKKQKHSERTNKLGFNSGKKKSKWPEKQMSLN
jgi:hypothetical protein